MTKGEAGGPSDLVCDADNIRVSEDDCKAGKSVKDWGSLAIVFTGIFLLGFGVSFYYSLGISYVDDNTERNNRYITSFIDY